MADSVRRLEKFESASGAVSYSFPLSAYEWTTQQGLRTEQFGAIGMDYAYDPLKNAASPANPAVETVRFFVVGASAAAVDTEIDTMKSELYTIGRGKLYTVTAAGVRRWAWARLAAMPDVRVGVPALVHVPVSLSFIRYSPWFASAVTTVTQAVDESPETFIVNNPGNLPAKLVTIRLRSNGAAGFTNPALANSMNNYSFASTRDAASANDELKVDTERMSVEYSDDDGGSYADDFALFSIGNSQGSFFQLEPGDNSLTYTDGGTPDLSIEIEFYAAFA